MLNLFLLPRYGAIAAAFTTALSQGVVALMSYYFAKDLTRPPLFAAVAISTPATCLMAACLVVVRKLYFQFTSWHWSRSEPWYILVFTW